MRIARAAVADACDEADGLYALAARTDRSLALAHAHALSGRLALVASMLAMLAEDPQISKGVVP